MNNTLTFESYVHEEQFLRRTVNHIGELLKDERDIFTHFEKGNNSDIPEMDYIVKIANMIINGIPLPELKFYQVNNQGKISITAVDKEDEKLFMALACLYCPHRLETDVDLSIKLPFDTVDFYFSDLFDRKISLTKLRKIENGNEQEQKDADSIEWIQIAVKSSKISLKTFWGKQSFDKYKRFAL